ncbi:GNAT family N-acetyltransferase [Candidatus Sumerlaeota bacterium]|nr:GNAT family N-acetyltransferase [Candidatus Sumerlaeota bacterium]
MGEYRIVDRAPTVEEFMALREAVRWENADPEITARGLRGALHSVCVLEGDRVIGCGRVIGDGGLAFYLQDIIVHPDHQGRGLGREITQRLMDHVQSVGGRGSYVGLMAAEGAAEFYEPFGFTRRPANAPGMGLWIGGEG